MDAARAPADSPSPQHWGVFSVPSWGLSEGGASGEWFWYEWQAPNGANNPAYGQFVNATQAPGWSYQNYANSFTAQLWNPAEWAQIFQASGAKYVVLTSKHHGEWQVFLASVVARGLMQAA
jgi:alpha-L-fucosidase